MNKREKVPYLESLDVCLSLWVDRPTGFIPAAIICFLTIFCMALDVKRPPLREINRALVLTLIEFSIESHLVIACLTAGVKNMSGYLYMEES